MDHEPRGQVSARTGVREDRCPREQVSARTSNREDRCTDCTRVRENWISSGLSKCRSIRFAARTSREAFGLTLAQSTGDLRRKLVFAARAVRLRGEALILRHPALEIRSEQE